MRVQINQVKPELKFTCTTLTLKSVSDYVITYTKVLNKNNF
jgi:hypothetical protein